MESNESSEILPDANGSKKHIPFLQGQLDNYSLLLGGEVSEEERKIIQGRKNAVDALLRYHQEDTRSW